MHVFEKNDAAAHALGRGEQLQQQLGRRVEAAAPAHGARRRRLVDRQVEDRAEHLLAEFQDRHGIDLRQGHPVAQARLWWAAEEAKTRLSVEPEVTIREEAWVTENGKPLNLELQVVREDYEAMIRPLLEKTLESVYKALADSGKSSKELDAILLVGGATRTPMVSRLLHERTGLVPREEIHPDLCVALGAGVLASRLAGHEVERVLVDVSPYSFGT